MRAKTLTACLVLAALVGMACPAVADHPEGTEYIAGPGLILGQDGIILTACPRGCSAPVGDASVPPVGMVEISVEGAYNNLIVRATDDVHGHNVALRACLADVASTCATEESPNTSDWACGKVLLVGAPVATSTAHVFVAALHVDADTTICGATHGAVLADLF